MTLFQTLRVALRAIWRNRMRSFLTTLGIIIGVGAVIAMLAIGAGAKAQVEQAFAAMGTNLLIIMSGSTSSGGSRGGFGSMPTLTWDDFAAIQNEVPSVKAAAPALRATQSLVSEEQNWTTSVTGTTPEYFDVRSWPIARGAGISQGDVDGATKVVVLGETVVEKLFGANSDPVGQSVRVGSTPFVVVGVAQRKGQSAMGQDYDDAAFIPYTTFARTIQGAQQVPPGQHLRGGRLRGGHRHGAEGDHDHPRERHRIARSMEDDFSIRNLSEIAGAQQQGTETMTTLLASVAAVSPSVGGSAS